MNIDLQIIYRLMFKLVQEDECWTWTGAQTTAGRGAVYGAMKVKGKVQRVHRVAYEAFKGKINDGMTVDHVCRNTLCCNPRHLKVMTIEENSRQSNEDHPRGVALPDHMDKNFLGF